MDNRFLKLPFHFDPILLQKDLNICLQKLWVKHYNQHDFSGNWESISLRSLSGEDEDIYSHPGEYKNTPLLSKCSYFRQIVECFQCPLESVRLLSLSPSGIIKEHRDTKVSYSEGVFRIHVPIQTGPGVCFIVDGCTLSMQPGETWYADFDLPHSVRNEGSVARIHLILDGIRNEWSDNLFRLAGYDFAQEERKKNYSAETICKMIAELETMEGPAVKRLIEELKQQQSL